MPSSREISTIKLTGCSPTPLASYLKALGVFRIIAEQLDSSIVCRWKSENLFLQTSSTKQELEEFFLSSYEPTPVLSPWNGGSGFFHRGQTKGRAVDQVASSDLPQLKAYRDAICAAEIILNRLQISEKPSDDDKERFILSCRQQLSNQAIRWLDAVFVHSQKKLLVAPLLGSGGNDGNFDFSSNFMQRLLEVLPDAAGALPKGQSLSLLQSALWETPTSSLLSNKPIGQFQPGNAGGANLSSGFEDSSLINPWDFIFLIEGSLLFAAAISKRIEDSTGGRLSYPFAAKPTKMAYASAAEEEAKIELWLPIWNKYAALEEVSALFGEGRMSVGGRPAVTGSDFARAVSSLGADRGISEFTRFGILQRNGKNFFATPLGRFRVTRHPEVDLLPQIDPWLDRFRAKVSPGKAPSSIARTLNTLDIAIVEMARRGGLNATAEVLIALGQCERALGNSLNWSRKSELRPIQPLTAEWLAHLPNSPEVRLAKALASIWAREVGGIRPFMEPVEAQRRGSSYVYSFSERRSRDVAAGKGSILTTLVEVLNRRILKAKAAGAKYYSDRSPCPARLDDVAAFLEGRVNLDTFERLLWGLMLVDWSDAEHSNSSSGLSNPSATWALLKLCFSAFAPAGEPIPIVPAIIRLAAAGDSTRAIEAAKRRLRGSGVQPIIPSIAIENRHAKRIAAALAFPISNRDLEILGQFIFTRNEKNRI